METREKKNDETASSGPNEKARPDRRPPARAEVDDFEEGPREHDSGRGGFVSEHSDANPGGTTGEHSGQRPPRKS